MGERNVLRDVIVVVLLLAIVVQLYVMIRQNEHDVAARMDKLITAQQSQEVTMRGVRDVMSKVLEEVKKPGRVIIGQQGTNPDNPETDTPSAQEKLADWEKEYIDPKAEEGGTLYRAFGSDPGTLNPLTENDATVSAIHQYISESLAVRDFKDLDQWRPDLATSWEEAQSSWFSPAKGTAESFVNRINTGLDPSAREWIKASAEKDGRVRLDIKKLGEGYQKVIKPLVPDNEIAPVQWVAAAFVPTAGDKDLPDPAKVIERFNKLVEEKKLKLPGGEQAWVTETGMTFRLPGSPDDAQKIVTDFLAQKEQQGPKGAVLAFEKTETYAFEDNLFFTFHLRPGVQWHDGTPLTTKDFMFSFKALKDPGVDCQPARNYYQDCTGLEALDDHTLRFRWRKLQANAFTFSAGLTLLPEHIYHYTNANDLNTHPRNNEAFGTGPYKFKEWLPKQRIVLERNENYWGVKPNYKRVYFRIVSESAVRLQMLKNKQIDISGLTPPQWQNDVKQPPFGQPHGLESFKQYDLYYNYIGWNARQPQLSDKRVRQALTMSINREKILHDLLYDLGAVVSGTFYHKGPYNDPNIKPYPFDPEKAAKLFEAAGWKDTDGDGYLDKDGKRFEVKIRFPAASETGKKILIAVQSDLKKAKVFCELDPIEWSVFLTRIKKREFDAIMLGWSLGWDPDPYQLWHSSQAAGEGSNHCYFVNKEADAIIEKLRKTFDQKERIELCHRFHAILHDEEPYTFMFNTMGLVGHNADIRNMYLPLKPGEEREQYMPLENEQIFSKYWWLPKDLQPARD